MAREQASFTCYAQSKACSAWKKKSMLLFTSSWVEARARPASLHKLEGEEAEAMEHSTAVDFTAVDSTSSPRAE